MTQMFSRIVLCTLMAVIFVRCGSETPAPSSETTGKITVGADRLFSEYFHLISGKKVGLVANHSGRLTEGTHLADTLHAHPDVELVALFGMEFNVRTNDYSLRHDPESTVDDETGVPKHNLYSTIHKPTPEMLEEVEILVFDIQGVGARFYEHVNILGFVMEAAAEQGIPVIVLDRPNPMGGLYQDGFVTDESQYYTFGSYTRIPVIHGMTMAELATMYNEEGWLRGGVKADLTVVEMKDWKRDMFLDETGMEWRKPSPNLITFESIVSYVGTCIFEALNVSEGRGTDKPFEYIGAPWIDNIALSDTLNKLGLGGVSFEPIEFTPERKPHMGRDPKLAGRLSKGIFVNVTDRDQFESYKAGVALYWAIHQLHSDSLVVNERIITKLSGTTRLKTMVEAGASLDEIYASWQPELEAYKSTSRKYRRYN